MSGTSHDLHVPSISSHKKNTRPTSRRHRHQQKHHNTASSRVQSLAKFRSKWECIIDKYSLIDDERESDEIDLATGRIIVDNGHLRTLGNFSAKRDPWGPLDLLEGDESGEPLDLPEIDECENACDAPLLKNEDLIDQRNRNSKTNITHDSHLLLHFPDPKPSLITAAKRQQYLEFYPLISSPETSPTKRRAIHRPNTFLDSSPVQSLHFSTLDLHPSRLSQSPVTESASVLDRCLPTKNPPSKTFLQQSPVKNPPPPKLSPLTSENSLSLVNTLLLEQDTPVLDTFSAGQTTKQDYLWIVDPFDLLRPKDTSIYACAFASCKYCTGNRDIYRQHLMNKHPRELVGLGYLEKRHCQDPIHPSATEAAKLLSQFPKTVVVPATRPLHCGRSLSGKKCQHSFLSAESLKAHREASPRECSALIQVLMCPILGCAFMTEDGFSDWRDHVESHNCRESALPATSVVHSKEMTFSTEGDSGPAREATLMEESDGLLSRESLLDELSWNASESQILSPSPPSRRKILADNSTPSLRSTRAENSTPPTRSVPAENLAQPADSTTAIDADVVELFSDCEWDVTGTMDQQPFEDERDSNADASSDYDSNPQTSTTSVASSQECTRKTNVNSEFFATGSR